MRHDRASYTQTSEDFTVYSLDATNQLSDGHELVAAEGEIGMEVSELPPAEDVFLGMRGNAEVTHANKTADNRFKAVSFAPLVPLTLSWVLLVEDLCEGAAKILSQSGSNLEAEHIVGGARLSRAITPLFAEVYFFVEGVDASPDDLSLEQPSRQRAWCVCVAHQEVVVTAV